MKIAIFGYGKMGKELEKILILKNYTILITANSKSKINLDLLKKCDLAFEFSNSQSAYNNIMLCLRNKVSVISGTTDWNINKKEINKICSKHKVAFLHASNFSLGINLINNIIPELKYFTTSNRNFSISIIERHHKTKTDSPSGTALDLSKKLNDKNIKIKSYRNETNQIGCHKIILKSENEEITIKHQALSRSLFAIGAIKYGEKIYNKIGFFNLALQKIN